MFGERGRRLFDSERTEIDELNAEYAAVGGVHAEYVAVGGVHVVGYAQGSMVVGEPIVRVDVSPMRQPQYAVIVKGPLRIGVRENLHDVEVFPDRTLVQPKVEAQKGVLTGTFVQTYRRRRGKKKEADFEQTIGELRVYP